MYLDGELTTFYRYVATYVREVAKFRGYTTTFGGYVADLEDT
jgi:hypothetical protein